MKSENVVVAEIDTDGMLTGEAREMRSAEADIYIANGRCVTFGTWEAFYVELNAQQRETEGDLID